jgi:hypothetical protein
MVNQQNRPSESGEQKIRLDTGEVITRDELVRRVGLRVWELWQEDLRLSRQRSGALRPKK